MGAGRGGRAVSTFRWAAEEARRFSGELQRLDTDPAATGRIALVRRVPRGPVLGISAVQLPAQPGRAQGRPGHRGRRADHRQAGPGHPAVRAAARRAARRDRPAGGACSRSCRCPTTAPPTWSPTRGCRWCRSPAPGRSARPSAAPVPDKHVTLELGGNAAAVICADWATDEDLDLAAQPHRHVLQLPGRPVAASRCSGSTCTRALYDAFLPRLVAAVEALRTGDPSDRADRRRARCITRPPPTGSRSGWTRRSPPARPSRWAAGASGATYPPTVLTGVPADAKVCAEEVFGPVLVVARGRRRPGRVRRGQRLGVRVAGRRVHPPPADAPSRAAPGAGGRRGDRRRRAVVPGRPDAVRRGEGQRRRPGGRCAARWTTTPSPASWC